MRSISASWSRSLGEFGIDQHDDRDDGGTVQGDAALCGVPSDTTCTPLPPPAASVSGTLTVGVDASFYVGGGRVAGVADDVDREDGRGGRERHDCGCAPGGRGRPRRIAVLINICEKSGVDPLIFLQCNRQRLSDNGSRIFNFTQKKSVAARLFMTTNVETCSIS